MSATFDVIPVVEQGDHGEHDRHEVQLALTPNAQRQVIRAVARAVLRANATGKPIHRVLLTAGVREIDEAQSNALDEAMYAIGHEWANLTVSPDEATALGRALLDAAEAPATCQDCGHFIDSDMPGYVCARCTETPKGLRSA